MQIAGDGGGIRGLREGDGVWAPGPRRLEGAAGERAVICTAFASPTFAIRAASWMPGEREVG